MITAEYIQTMAKYGAWQNDSVFAAADTLNDAERRQDRGAFFGSIHGTLNHLLWGDQILMSRFAGTPDAKSLNIPGSTDQIDNWEDLKRERRSFDGVITNWAEKLDPDWLDGSLTWFSIAADREITAPLGLLVAHMFNHQTHHRGQANAMLTAAGAKPDDTDLMLLALRND